MLGNGAPFEAPVKPEKRLAWGVAIGHALLLLFLITDHLLFSRAPPKKGIKIHTVQRVPEKALPSKPVAALSSSAKKTVSTAPPLPPKKTTTKSPPSKSTKKPSPAPTAQISTPLFVPEPIAIPSFQKAPETVAEVSYEEILSGYLQNTLELPELGSVTVELVLKRDGTLYSCQIVKTENPKNSEFLKKRLPELHFPCLNKSDAQEALLPVTIVFKNR